MAYCSLNTDVEGKMKELVNDFLIKCHDDVNDDNIEQLYKVKYIPLLKIVNDSDLVDYKNTSDIIECGGKYYFKMTYKNIQKFGDVDQSMKYHNLRKDYLCRVMSKAVEGTDFCYKMMGSNSPASDVDISIFSTSIIPENPEEHIKKIIKTYNDENEKHFGDQSMADVFDANIYFTNFLQIFQVLDNGDVDMKKGIKEVGNVVKSKIQGMKKDYGVGTISDKCFSNATNNTINAKALYISSVNNPIQREYAAHRLAQYFAFNGLALEATVKSGFATINLTNKDLIFFSQFRKLFEKCGENHNEISSNPDETRYESLLSEYFKLREKYLTEGMSNQEKANEIINKLSFATFWEDEAYHSQGAFLDINAQKDWNLVLNVDDYLDSIFENLGFMMEYSDMKKHTGMTPFARYEKSVKYYGRVTNALIKIIEDKEGCNNVMTNVRSNAMIASKQDEQRKKCSNTSNVEVIDAYNYKNSNMISRFTNGFVNLNDVTKMTHDNLTFITKSMLKRTINYMLNYGVMPYENNNNVMTTGGRKKKVGGKKVMNVKIESMNVASMIAPVIGGKKSRKSSR
jgi:hypothetical protein